MRSLVVRALAVLFVLVTAGCSQDAPTSAQTETTQPRSDSSSPQTASEAQEAVSSSITADLPSTEVSLTEAERNTLVNLQSGFAKVSRAVLPVVVEVNVVNVVQRNQPQSPFDFFFSPPGQGDNQQEFRRQGLGSGVIVRRDGNTYYAITNAHVAGEAEEITVVLYDGREFNATRVGSDTRLDLALLEFESDAELPVATFGDSGALVVGQWAVAVGNPFGFESTVTAGIVSALGRRPEMGSLASSFTDFIQTDASINPGNSGGGLVNLGGEVIGINTWIASQSGGSVGLGFAIPSNTAQKAIADFIEYGKVIYGWLGAQIADANPQVYPNIRQDLELDDATGALVVNLYRGSPADEAGILPGDFITRIGDTNVRDSSHLTRVVGRLSPGAERDFEFIRYGESRETTVRITEREEPSEDGSENLWPGFYLVNITGQVRARLQMPSDLEGLIVMAVVQGSPAAQSGFVQGDIIQSVGGTSVSSMQGFYRALNQAGDSVDVALLRRGSQVRLRLE